MTRIELKDGKIISLGEPQEFDLEAMDEIEELEDERFGEDVLAGGEYSSFFFTPSKNRLVEVQPGPGGIIIHEGFRVL